MDIILKIVGFIGSVVAAGMTVVMLLTFRKPRRISTFPLLSSVLLSGILLPIYIWISGVPINFYVGFPFLCLGLLVGFLRGHTTQLRFVGNEVFGQHSWFFLLAWGSSLALSQLLNLFGGGLLASLGLLPVFLSTGTQIGLYGNLLLRRISLVSPEQEQGVISNATFNRAIGWGFGVMILALLFSSTILSISTIELFQPAPVEAALVEVSDMEIGGEALEVSPTAEPEIAVSPTDTPIFLPTEVLIWTRPDWAFLVEGPYDLYAVDVETQQARKVMETSVMTLYTPEISPDGKTLIFMRHVDQNTDLYARPILTGEVTRLTDNPGFDTSPAWSPDGQWILYRSVQEGRYHVCRMRPDGSEQTSLFSNTQDVGAPIWSNDGNRIAINLGSEGEGEIYVMNADGSNVMQISQQPSGWEWQPHRPTWSADDRLILAAYYDDQFEVRIVAVQTEGGGQDPLGDNLDDVLVSWSPDGAQVAYTNIDIDGEIWQNQIYKINVDGSGVVNLSNNLYDDFNPVWSPDGQWIAYESMGDLFTPGAESMWEVYVMRADGSGQQRLTNNLWAENDVLARVLWP
jgi:TolB protein